MTLIDDDIDSTADSTGSTGNAVRSFRRRRRGRPRTPTDHERELRRIDDELAAGEPGPARRARLLVERAGTSGVPGDLTAARVAVDAGLRGHQDHCELALLRAELDLDEGRPGRVAGRLVTAGVDASAEGLAVLGDAEAQLGHLAHAEGNYRAALTADFSWRAKAGLARLAAQAGDRGAADMRYGELETGLPATSHALAVVRAQRALMASATGAPVIAWAHVQAARVACSGCWVVAVAAARVMHRAHRLDAAVGWWGVAIGAAPRPELMRELADVLVAKRAPDAARRWYAMALAAYLASAGRGEAVHLRHLADYYAEVAGDRRAAAIWAERARAAAHEPLAG
ncbi:MAG: hypothetical protein ACJ74O_02910 [Frankiaceae bacterium]